jgi:glycine/D-amino acid oxidase-like deaminating enzyme
MISIWEKETFFAPQDVIIAGSGFVGLWSAFYLKRKHPKLKITILERGMTPTGASTRNAGFACFGSLSELMFDAKTMGTENMLKLVEMRFKGLQKIQKFFKKKKIDYENCGGYELFDSGTSLTTDELQNSLEYMNSVLRPIIHSKNTYNLSNEAKDEFGFGNTTHIVKNNLEGYLHSGKLLQALLQEVQYMGVQVFTNIEITSFNLIEDELEIQTNKEMDFNTKKFLVCTNAFAKELVPELDVVPARGQVLLTSEIAGLPWKGAFHSDEGYYYFRNLGSRVLLGGARNKAFADERTTAIETTELIQKELERYLEQIVIPNHAGSYTIDQRWSGIMAMGSEKMPIVKEVSPHIFCAVRMSGMGVALAPTVGQQITSLMYGD